MKTFKQFLKEAREDVLPKEEIDRFYKSWSQISDIADYDYEATEVIYKNIQNNKYKGSFKELDKKLKYLEDTIKKYPFGTSYSVSDFTKMKEQYEKRKSDFDIDDKCFNLVKIGDKQEDAIKKLVNGLNDKEINKRFDKESEESILDQIERFKGTVVINGGTDLYIQFKDGKVVKKYF